MTKVTEVARVASVRVAEGSRELGRRVQEQHIGEKVAVSSRLAAAPGYKSAAASRPPPLPSPQTSLTAVSAAVADPNLLTNVQAGATSFWQRASDVGPWLQRTWRELLLSPHTSPPPSPPPRLVAGAGLFKATATSVTSLIDDFKTVPPAGSGAAAPAPAAADATRTRPPASSGNTRAAASAAPPAAAFSEPVAEASAPAEDDETWLARQVAASLQLGGNGGAAKASAPAPAPAADGWTDAEWDDEADAASSPPKPTPAAASAAPASSALLDEMEALSAGDGGAPSSSGAVAVAPSAPAPPKPAPVESPDDFFAAFGVK